MSRPLTVRRSLALTSALVVAAWGAVALPAQADPGSGQSGAHSQAHGGNGNGNGQATAPGQTKDKDKSKSKDGKDGKDGDKHGNNGNGNGQGNGNNGNGNGNGQGNGNNGNGQSNGQSNGPPNGQAGGSGDPGGNNGTIKITPIGEDDGIPQNSPHPGCGFQIEWYGFDEGADVISTVSFAMHAPTKDVGLTVLSGDTTKFVGGDPATGAGTDTGKDGVEVYELGFDGAPHPKQGYHVKVIVATPRAHGNDTKSKVFWVAPCDSADTAGAQGDESDGGGGAGVRTGDTEVLGTQASTGDTTEVAPAQSDADVASVPTAVDAGEQGGSVIDWVRSPLPLLAVALGLALAAAALVSRRRGRVDAGR